MPTDQTLSLPSVGAPRLPRLARFAFIGLVLWFIAAMFICSTQPLGWFAGGSASLLAFALTAPGAWALVRALRAVSPAPAGELVAAIAVASAVGLAGDGVAMTWAPALYGTDSAHLLPAAAWLMWGVACCLAAAVFGERAKA